MYEFGTRPALDIFIVSVGNDRKKLCMLQAVNPYKVIEKFKVNHQNLEVEKLFVLARTVSSHCPSYKLHRNQCYWYASVVWDILLELARDNHEANVTYSKSEAPRKGTNMLFRFLTVTSHIHESDKPAALWIKYTTGWTEFRSEVEPRLGVS